MTHFDTDPNGADVYSRPLAPWEDQQPTSPTSATSEHSGKIKRNVLQTPAFKTAIAALGKKQPHVPLRDRTREEIAKGTDWGTFSLAKTPFWAIKDDSTSAQQQQQQQYQHQQIDYYQQPIEYQQEPVVENVLATFDISFVSDAELGISITPSKTDVDRKNGFQPPEMTLEKSTDSSTVSTQPQPTATTSRSSIGSIGYGGSEVSMWATIREEERVKAEKEAAAKETKWNPKAQSFQFNPTSTQNNSIEKPVSPIFEFAKPLDEPEKPFFAFTGNDRKDPPLFDFSTALNAPKLAYPDETNQSYEYSEQQDSTLLVDELQDFTFSVPVSKKVVISSPDNENSSSTSNTKPNPEAPAFTPTSSNAPVASKATWNPKVTEFIPSPNNQDLIQDDPIPSFVTRPKSIKATLRAPLEEDTVEDLNSQSQPETTRGLKEPIPILHINVSFAPGVTSALFVFENDSPKHVVADFCRKHDLTMTQKAQNSFIDTLTKLTQAKLTSLSKNP
jgi:hypothetical protein